MSDFESIRIIDSHTAGEPTRVVVEGGPRLQGDTVLQQREAMRRDHDWLRTACLNEPRGHEAIVGAMLLESQRDDCVAGVIFFNNVGYLGGCIHGTIGLAQTLVHLGKISNGEYGIETPVGRVVANVDDDGTIAVRNVPSYRYRTGVSVQLPDGTSVVGDIAWGGNWFFLVDHRSTSATETDRLTVSNVEALTRMASSIRHALADAKITGANAEEIDHIELFAPPEKGIAADSKNFVLCPGHVYDRSPCGTGTSAKLACLAADKKLVARATWRQSGILDTLFEGSYEQGTGDNIIPTIRGRAFVNAETKLIIHPSDPFRFGIPNPSSFD